MYLSFCAHIFPDDTNIFCPTTDPQYMIRLVNEEMSKTFAWVNANNHV